MAQESVVLVATICSEADKVAQRVSTLKGELVAVRQAQDVAEDKIPNLAAKAAAAKWQWVATDEQWEHLVHELTLLNLRGFELCMTITGTPLHEGMTFAVVHHIEVVMWLSTLWVAVSLAA
jgi:hypothetical protein